MSAAGQVDADAFDAEGAGGDVRERAGVRRGLLDNYDDVEGYYNFQARALVHAAPLATAQSFEQLINGMAI